MDDSLEEVRYPWRNILEFVAGGYPVELSALHLTIGWAVLCVLTVRALGERRFPWSFRLSILYFSLTVFSNPAYELAGLRFNELCGIGAVLAMRRVATTLLLSKASIATLFLCGTFYAGLTHALITAAVYPQLTPDLGSFLLKLALNAKVAVLALNVLIVGDVLRTGKGFEALIQYSVVAGTCGLLLYLWQAASFATGFAVPYGTYLDAGFVGVPSFGSVATERGHFGKLMAAYYAFFLAALLMWGWKWRFALLICVTAINFSASSQAYFVAFAALAIWTCRSRLRDWHGMVAVVSTVLFVGVIFATYEDAFYAVGNKIHEIAISGDESSGGGRSFDTFVVYISSFPLGIGYGGSTLRNVPGFPEINSGYYAFAVQYSILAIPIALVFFAILWKSQSIQVKWQRSHLTMAMTAGALLAPVIFAADILWFVPLIWLPFEMLLRHGSTTAGRQKVLEVAP